MSYETLRRLMPTPAMVVTVALGLSVTGCPSTEPAHDGSHEDGAHDHGAHEDGAHDHASEPEGDESDGGGHVHVFKCPDHPEVTSGKAGECPECGKKLEHQD